MKLIKLTVSLSIVLLLLSLFTTVSESFAKDIEEKVSDLELKVSKMKLYFDGDYRFRYDYVGWTTPRYRQPDMSGNLFQMGSKNLKNSESYSWRLRLKFGADISDNLHFYGRLNAYKLFGGADVPIFNGTPETVHNSFNSTRIPTDNVIRVERAYFTYTFPSTPVILTIGRQAATDGPPRQVKLDTVRQGTPVAILIDAEIEGIMAGLKLDDWGLPDGSRARVCYGVGYESGFGSGGNAEGAYVINPMGSGLVTNLNDSKVVGGCLDLPFTLGFTDLTVCTGYFRIMDITDIPYGLTRNFPNFQNNDPQNVTATQNLGDIDLLGFSVTHDMDWLTYFVSLGYCRSNPNGKESMYGFGGLLGNPRESESGTAIYLGAKAPLRVIDAQVGFEYNQGSEHWWSYTAGADDVSNKLATRGNVTEMYFNYNFDKNITLRAAYARYNYKYAFSGWHIAPGSLDYFDLEQNPAMPYPFPKSVDNFFVSTTVNF